MFTSDAAPEERLNMQFKLFLLENRGISIEEAHEEPHFLNFMEYLVERPVLVRDGKLAEKPIKASWL